ncbi:MAG: glycosyltransferase, partial [Candidatus Methylomirabilales bacterium]
MDRQEQVSKPTIFVTVGTDHHPFDRLLAWVDDWLANRARGKVHCFVQSGTSRPPRQAEWKDYLRYEEMEEAIGHATVVVCHGGPGTIMDVRHRGLVPIVVPRLSRLGEHVDDHQVAFTKRIAAVGAIRLAGSPEQLMELLDRAVLDPDEFRAPPAEQEAAEAVRRFEKLVENLMETPSKA